MAERVLAELVEMVPGGVEEERGAGYVEYAIYGPPGELPELPDIEVAAGDGLVEIETTDIPDDWADRWRDFHEPVWVGERLVVRPSWEGTAEPREGSIEIVIDPGQAFGTGAHATTSMSLELLLELAETRPERGAICDLGTGSGVLAIAAAQLGFGPVFGFDHELAGDRGSDGEREPERSRGQLRAAQPPRARRSGALSLARQSDGAAAAHGCRADPDPERAGPADRQRHARRRAPAGHRGLRCTGLLSGGHRERGDWAALRFSSIHNGADRPARRDRGSPEAAGYIAPHDQRGARSTT